MGGKPEPRQITVFYEQNVDYKLIAATGVHGGPIPAGDILVEFFVERRTAPDNITLEIGENKPKEISRKGGKFVREIQVGILLRADVAYSIGKWLIDKAAEVGYTEIKQ
ncbi:MAG: hypothetical protein M0P73_06060 [Syntrophobacterales bacterium]|jgi:hypothetical protein|nr:hypothetical protein [Syntrophobacterales bacterium]